MTRALESVARLVAVAFWYLTALFAALLLDHYFRIPV